MIKWEYKQARIIPSEIDGYMRGMGDLGWELVTVNPTEYGHEFFFKRPTQREGQSNAS